MIERSAIPGLLNAALAHPRRGAPSFTVRHRAVRLWWRVTWAVLGAWTPVAMHGWRRFLLRLFGASIDRTAKVYPGVRVWYPPNLTLEAWATIGPQVDCYCVAPITLRRHALVSQRAFLCTATHQIDDPAFPLIAAPIDIGPDGWVAAEAFVGPGVAVGEGAVLGARGVTVRNLDPWTVYAGNPARRMRARTRHVT